MENDKKVKILESAIVVFSGDGYHQAKVEDIANLAGVGKGTIYQYFQSKKVLFLETLKYIFERMLEQLVVGIEEYDSSAEKFTKIIDNHTAFIRENMDMVRITVNDSGQFYRDFHENAFYFLNKALALIEEVVIEGQKKGELKTGDPAAAAQMFLGIFHANAINVIFSQTEEKRGIIKEMLDIFLYGVKN
jgi:TetR/AcrR family fatty acid metabolism transcriptional regulator